MIFRTLILNNDLINQWKLARFNIDFKTCSEDVFFRAPPHQIPFSVSRSTIDDDDAHTAETDGDVTGTSEDSFDFYGRMSPTTILEGERQLLRPETDLSVRLPPVGVDTNVAHFLAVPVNSGDEYAKQKYGAAVSLRDRFPILLPQGLLRNPTPCKFKILFTNMKYI